MSLQVQQAKLEDLEKEVFQQNPELEKTRPENCWKSDTLEAAVWRRLFEHAYRPHLCEQPRYKELFKHEDMWLKSRPIDKVLREYEHRTTALEYKNLFTVVSNSIKSSALGKDVGVSELEDSTSILPNLEKEVKMKMNLGLDIYAKLTPDAKKEIENLFKVLSAQQQVRGVVREIEERNLAIRKGMGAEK